MSDLKTYHITARVQKRVNQSIINSDCDMKLDAANINDATEQFKIKVAQAGWQRAWISTVTAIERELVD